MRTIPLSIAVVLLGQAEALDALHDEGNVSDFWLPEDSDIFLAVSCDRGSTEYRFYKKDNTVVRVEGSTMTLRLPGEEGEVGIGILVPLELEQERALKTWVSEEEHGHNLRDDDPVDSLPFSLYLDYLPDPPDRFVTAITGYFGGEGIKGRLRPGDMRHYKLIHQHFWWHRLNREKIEAHHKKHETRDQDSE